MLLDTGVAKIESRSMRLFPDDTTDWGVSEALGGDVHIICNPECPDDITRGALEIAKFGQDRFPSGIKSIGSGSFGAVASVDSSNGMKYAAKIRGGSFGAELDYMGLGPDSAAAITAVHQGVEEISKDRHTIYGLALGAISVQATVFPVDPQETNLNPVIVTEYVEGSRPSLLDWLWRRKDLEETLLSAVKLTDFPEENVHHDFHWGNFIVDANKTTITKIDTGAQSPWQSFEN